MRLGARIRDEGFYRRPKGKQWEEKALAAVENALSLDSELAEGDVAGYLLWSLANHCPHEKAVQDFQRALALNPAILHDRALTGPWFRRHSSIYIDPL